MKEKTSTVFASPDPSKAVTEQCRLEINVTENLFPYHSQTLL